MNNNSIINDKKRYCPVCNEVIIGRSDKKYCSDQCRATANNQLKNESEKLIIEFNKRLRKNRTILKTLCPVGKSTVRKSVLVDMGFNFSSFTNMYLSPQGYLYYLTYDYGFSPIIQKGVEKALIITRQEYISSYEWQPWKYVHN